MNPQAIAFEGEFQFRRYSDTSTQGQQVVFAVADRSALEAFIGKEGKRFAAVLVEIGDDEQPVVQPKKKVGELCLMAVNFCKDPAFWSWLAESHGIYCFNQTEAREFIISRCRVASRKELDSNVLAASYFHNQIRKPFIAWREA